MPPTRNATIPALLLLASMAMPADAVEIDGRIAEGEWAGARHVTDFRLTQPLSREPATLATEAWILATEEGLAIAFRNAQPAGVPRNRQRGQRDRTGAVDRVNAYIDFDGDGRTGYNFTLSLSDSISDSTITNENRFSDDWDGIWTHAVTEDADGWSAEMLIPWHVATMRRAADGRRTLGIGLDRVVSETGERFSWPAVGFNEARFLSVLERVEVPAYSQSLLAVTPYVVGVHDNVAGSSDFDAGADVFWKPHGRFQLSGTLNPDFGQVESDELVVNFSATETFFSDKRPFFTENQGFFDVPFGSLNQVNRLVYTRRVGAPADDGNGAGDVRAAAKLNGSLGAFNYGIFAAVEGEEAGRDFYAVRGTRDFDLGGFGSHGLGAMVTRVVRPWLDRTANVYELDHRWASAPWNVRTTVVASDIEQAGTDIRDSGAQVIVDRDDGGAWRQQLYALHLGRDLQLNDFGFLERNDFNYLRYELGHRITSLPEDSPYSGHQWRFAGSTRYNDRGDLLANAVSVNRSSERRDGGNSFFDVAVFGAGKDDRITRGNGIVEVPEKLYAFYERYRPRRGHWSLYGNARYAAEGLDGADAGSLAVYVQPTFHFNDSLTFNAGMQFRHNPDWLLWRGGNLLGSYRANQLYLNAGATWLIDDRQELRVRLEAIGLDAEARQAWRVAEDGTPVAVDEAIPDFALRNLGFQIRYRYELAPLSHLYIAYVRGGALFEQSVGGRFSAIDQFSDAFDLRDDEQLLVKLAYRFEI
ncbi:DUF5916 domain-containing protein [Luteimonas vadosa]|uniref:DUF5916 domain-containing protein n=1 Tax=Luteimonas vadosa TaxID=1165507 RepID=A0ABP9DYB5_9GAMM